MKTLLKPRALAIVETLQGQKVRIVPVDPATEKVRVKSLQTGLSYVTSADQLQLPG